MDWVLGLDGGGTGCRAILADRQGRVLGRGEAGPANVMSDREGTLANIMTAAAGALDGRPAARVAACLGLAGANISGARDWLAPMLPFGRARVVHDAITSVAGALGGRDGIVAAIGTGSVFSRQLGAAFVSIGGWGPVLGDEASGAWLGRKLLAHALRAQDGLAESSQLVAEVLAQMGGPAGIVAFARTATGAQFAALVPQIVGVAAGDTNEPAPDPVADPVAAAILSGGLRHVIAAVDHLQPSAAASLPVAFIGGLGPIYAARSAGRWPQIAAQGSALDGALRLAQDLAQRQEAAA